MPSNLFDEELGGREEKPVEPIQQRIAGNCPSCGAPILMRWYPAEETKNFGPVMGFKGKIERCCHCYEIIMQEIPRAPQQEPGEVELTERRSRRQPPQEEIQGVAYEDEPKGPQIYQGDSPDGTPQNRNELVNHIRDSYVE
jgi:hypothetical protein